LKFRDTALLMHKNDSASLRLETKIHPAEVT
jgi:hypothetical protein